MTNRVVRSILSSGPDHTVAGNRHDDPISKKRMKPVTPRPLANRKIYPDQRISGPRGPKLKRSHTVGRQTPAVDQERQA